MTEHSVPQVASLGQREARRGILIQQLAESIPGTTGLLPSTPRELEVGVAEAMLKQHDASGQGEWGLRSVKHVFHVGPQFPDWFWRGESAVWDEEGLEIKSWLDGHTPGSVVLIR